MSDTAVGLFLNAAVAKAAVDALGADGFPAAGIRTIAAPSGGSGDSPTSTPLIDFEAALTRDLRSMGATESECETYTDGLRNGEVLVFATGTAHEATMAIDVFDEYAAIEVEEFVGAAPNLPSASHGFTGVHSISAKEDRIRARTTGAKVFSW